MMVFSNPFQLIAAATSSAKSSNRHLFVPPINLDESRLSSEQKFAVGGQRAAYGAASVGLSTSSGDTELTETSPLAAASTTSASAAASSNRASFPVRTSSASAAKVLSAENYAIPPRRSDSEDVLYQGHFFEIDYIRFYKNKFLSDLEHPQIFDPNQLRRVGETSGNKASRSTTSVKSEEKTSSTSSSARTAKHQDDQTKEVVVDGGWREEFDTCVDGKPDPSAWEYETGTPRPGNWEAQEYTDQRRNAYCTPEGTLVLKAFCEEGTREECTKLTCDNQHYPIKCNTRPKEAPSKNENTPEAAAALADRVRPWISSASLQMKKESVSAGTLMARVRGNDTALGAWSALWLMGTQWRDAMNHEEQNFTRAGKLWPQCGEVDIRELNSKYGIIDQFAFYEKTFWTPEYANIGGVYLKTRDMPRDPDGWAIFVMEFRNFRPRDVRRNRRRRRNSVRRHEEIDPRDDTSLAEATAPSDEDDDEDSDLDATSDDEVVTSRNRDADSEDSDQQSTTSDSTTTFAGDDDADGDSSTSRKKEGGRTDRKHDVLRDDDDANNKEPALPARLWTATEQILGIYSPPSGSPSYIPEESWRNLGLATWWADTEANLNLLTHDNALLVMPENGRMSNQNIERFWNTFHGTDLFVKVNLAIGGINPGPYFLDQDFGLEGGPRLDVPQVELHQGGYGSGGGASPSEIAAIMREKDEGEPGAPPPPRLNGDTFITPGEAPAATQRGRDLDRELPSMDKGEGVSPEEQVDVLKPQGDSPITGRISPATAPQRANTAGVNWIASAEATRSIDASRSLPAKTGQKQTTGNADSSSASSTGLFAILASPYVGYFAGAWILFALALSLYQRCARSGNQVPLAEPLLQQ